MPQPAPEPHKPALDAVLKLIPLVVATLMILGSMAGYNTKQDDRFATLSSTDALVYMRIARLETDSADAKMVQAKRTEQWQEVFVKLNGLQTDIAAIKTRLDQIDRIEVGHK